MRIIIFLGLMLTTTIVLSFSSNYSSEKDLLELSLEALLEVNVTTASRQEQNVLNAPASIIVINAEQIRKRHYINLSDLLQDLPSVDIQRRNEEHRFHTISIRGNAGNNKFLILQNGIRIDSPTSELIPIADNFPLYHAKQVEILYGPAAALYGADAFVGVINIITELPENIEGLGFSTSIGTDNYHYHSAHLGKTFDNDVKLVLGGHKHYADGFDIFDNYPIEYFNQDDDTRHDNYKNALNPERSHSFFGELKLGDTLVLGMNHSFFRGLTSNGAKPDTVIYDVNARWDTQLDTVYLKYRTHLTDNLQSETLLNYTRYEVDPSSKFINMYSNFDNAYKYAKGEKSSIEQQFNYKFNDKHNIILGLLAEHYYTLPKTADLPSPYNTLSDTHTQTMYYQGTRLPVLFFDHNYENIGSYLQLSSKWNDKFSSTLGLRYDHHTNYGDALNPRVSFIHHVSSRTSMKWQYGESFRAPSAGERFSYYGSIAETAPDKYSSEFIHAPNPYLKPEKARTWEFSVTRHLREGLYGLLSAYYMEVDNLIMPIIVPPIQFIPNTHILTTEINDNLGTAQYYGSDISLNYKKSWDLWQTEWWANYSFVNGYTEKDSVRSDLPHIAKHKLKIGSTITYDKYYFITPTFYVIDRTNSGKVDPINTTTRLQSPGYVVMDLHLGAEHLWDTNLSAYFSIHNVFNTHHYHAGGLSGMTYTATPQPLREFMFSLRYQFQM